MTLDYAKQELVRRYRYLYENACFILAPYMYEQGEQEFKKQTSGHLQRYGVELLNKPLIYLNIDCLDDINVLFEEFLLSDKEIERTLLYQFVENNKMDKGYLDKVKNGLALVEKDNYGKNHEMFKTTIDMGQILKTVSDYIELQSGDLENKKGKLSVIDEYYRIFRYQNNGKIYTSGRTLNLHDVSSIAFPLHKCDSLRGKKDIGVTSNDFITAIANAPRYEDNLSIFTEGEKQEIYLNYHDELPCDLEIACEHEEEYNKTMTEIRLYRPENTEPCGENFVVKEEEIFVRPNDSLYKYYQLCPHCGYMVNIPKEVLSEGIKKRIDARCSRDDKLFRKMFLYSELFSLDKKSTEDQKKLLKKYIN